MGFINSKDDEYYRVKYSHKPEYVGKYCYCGLYDSDTDLVEVFILPERKRTIMDVECVERVSEEVKRTVKLLYMSTK